MKKSEKSTTCELESDLERKLVAWCQSKDYLCLKLAIQGRRGFPDRTIIDDRGRITFLELKRPKSGKLSPQQVFWIGQLAEHSHSIFPVDNLEHAISIIER